MVVASGFDVRVREQEDREDDSDDVPSRENEAVGERHRRSRVEHRRGEQITCGIGSRI